MKILELFNLWTDAEKKQALASMPLFRRIELAKALMAAGWTPSALMAAGWTPSDLMAAGLTPSDLMADGLTPSDLLAAGLTPSALMAAGWTPSDLMTDGLTPSDLMADGLTPSALMAAGWTPSDLMAAGLTPSDLMADGLTPSDLLAAGLTPSDLKFESDIKAKAKKMGKDESAFIVESLNRGLMNGLNYGTLNSCGCFLGTAAKKAGKSVEEYCRIHEIVKDESSPAEEWFMAVRVGDTPENNFAAKMGVKWISEAIEKQP